MRPIVLCALSCLLASQPALARSQHHRYRHDPRRSHDIGEPITAQAGSIRINSVGEVISQPTPVIQKERTFFDRSRKDLSGKPDPLADGKPPARP